MSRSEGRTLFFFWRQKKQQRKDYLVLLTALPPVQWDMGVQGEGLIQGSSLKLVHGVAMAGNAVNLSFFFSFLFFCMNCSFVHTTRAQNHNSSHKKKR